MPRKGYVLFVLFLLASAMFVGRAFSADKNGDYELTLKRLIKAVEDEYVEKVETQKLYEGAYRGLLSELDPYSQYFTIEETTTFTEDTEGQFGGLGIEISIKDGILTVLSPLRDTPAWEAGILAGDMVLKIDGESTEGIMLDQALHKLRGKVGTTVTLTIRHAGSIIDNEVTIVRAVIKPKSVEAVMLDDKTGIGLIRVISFNGHALEDLVESAKTLQEEGMKGLILDLRGNPGGLLDMAVDMSDLFLKEGVIVSVRGRRSELDVVKKADAGEMLESTPVVVLIDQASASASEILAAALKDNNRAMLVGMRTFGKGSVQNVFSLGNGEALKLTTARYYRPNNEPILDRQGIIPDIQVPMTAEEILALRNQEREDKLRGAYDIRALIQDPVEPPKSDEKAEEETPGKEGEPRRTRAIDTQLKAAFNILKWQLAQGS